MRTREFFKITKIAKKYDKTTGKFLINLSYKTRTEITPRTIAVAEAFGLGVDEEREFTIYDNVELKIGPTDIVYVTGNSGSGKSILLRNLERELKPDAVNIQNVKVDPGKPLIDTVGETLEQGLELLSRVGLNDAFLFVRRYSQLSDGQKYRYRVAKMIEVNKQYWIMDEFASMLDRDTAKIVAFNVQKMARKEGKAVLAATTHIDLFEDLKPSVYIHKKFGKEIKVEYYPNEINKTCSLTKEMYVAEGSKEDYEKVAQFHYRDAKGLVATQKILVLKRGDEVVGAIVYKYPAIATFGRRKAFGRVLPIEEINRDLALISRVVIHPKYRTIGLGVKLVKETLPLIGKPYVETVAVMARYNPFFERGGMIKVAESTPNERVIAALEKLSEIGFNPVFLSSEAYNMKKLRSSDHVLSQVRDVLKEVSRRSGIYRKRLASIGKAFLKHKEFCELVDKADIPKLARMLKILSILAQKKVYLFWKKSEGTS